MVRPIRQLLAYASALLVVACTPPDWGEPSHIAIPPAVTIQAPSDQASFTDTDSIELVAIVYDGNGLDDILSVDWSSNLQGPLGVPTEQQVPDAAGICRLTVMLQTGIHSLEISVSDADGLHATDAITLFVDESHVMPTAEILDPADLDVFDIGADIPMLGLASDPNQPLDTLWARWTAVSLSSGNSVLLGDYTPDAAGSTATTFVDPDPDAYVVALEVTDDDGNRAVDHVQITVRDPSDLDNDLDGWTINEGDCDDGDPDMFPGNPEVCDGRDNDCDNTIDDKDADIDHHVDVLCTAYPGPLAADDCDDTRADVFPGAAEMPDAVDQDCDGLADEGTIRFDDDGDCFCEGPGVCTGSIEPACGTPNVLPGDCDDFDIFVSPADFDLDGVAGCDGDCDDREPLLNVNDVDADGVSTCAGDCDDDPAGCGADCWPGHAVADVCDGHNQDCDVFVDEDADIPWYPDLDLDGYTDVSASMLACTDPDGSALRWLATATIPDCNDSNAALNPADADADGSSTCAGDCDETVCGAGCFPGNPAPDVCDGRNQDCDAFVDENPDLDWFHDADLDGYTDVQDDEFACVDPDGTALAWLDAPTADDCNDANALISPADVDLDGASGCAGDCDDTTPGLNIADADADGASTCAGDCDDNPATCGAGCFPGNLAPDICDGRNQDCDAVVDENPNVPWYHDADADGWTNLQDTTLACADPDGTALAWLAVATLDDCDDLDPALNYDDADNDTYSTCEDDCDDLDPLLEPADRDFDGWATCDGDCDDDPDPSLCGADCFPLNAVPDLCDDFDQDCDGDFDEEPDLPWFHDADGDGYTDLQDSTLDCDDPDGTGSGWVFPGTTDDCDDTDALVSPADVDLDGASGCAGDCNDTTPALNIADRDSDGWNTCEGDCDDDPLACGADCFPGHAVADVCDDFDQDCDTQVDENPNVPWYHDVDGDGFTTNTVGQLACDDPDGAGLAWRPTPTASLDCDDNPLGCGDDCFPGNTAADVCDGQNQDCDAQVDENPNIPWYHDLDGDGFTLNTDTVQSCTDPDGLDVHWLASPTANDCDDSPATCGAGCWPGNPAADVCDGRDQDCDNSVDENPNVSWYRDQDLDGWTAATGSTLACADPDGATGGWLASATNPTDCDDGDAALNHDDDDNDLWDTCEGDCDDNPASCGSDCFPGHAVADVCDDRDQDCDGSFDENPNVPWYHDVDGDGFTTNTIGQYACDDPDGAGLAWRASPTAIDCDDNPLGCGDDCFPGNPAADVCDGQDQDCDAQVDEQPNIAWYHDLDGDGFTRNVDTVSACADPDGLDTHWLASPTTNDCDDSPATCGAGCWPGNPAADVCDGRDQDCDTQIDEQPNLSWHRDQDLDGWTAAGGSTLACTDPDGASAGWIPTATNPTDCDDGDAALNHDDDDNDQWDTCEGDCDDNPLSCGSDCYPGHAVADVCDNRDQDCDGTADENPNTPWYRDQDLDGYTLATVGQFACTDPDGASGGWLGTATALVDCDDNPATCGDDCFPGNPAADVCDGRNQDCDASIDENPNVAWYHDLDGDGYTLNTDTVQACADPDGLDVHWLASATANDCDDSPATCGVGCWPGNPAADVCDGRNQDCDGSVDEQPNISWYRDQDLDTWTAATGSTLACADPDGALLGWLGAATNPADCDDANASLNHNDADADSYDTCEGDCDDNPASCGNGCFPGNPATDVCDSRDQDCDGTADENPDTPWYRDQDLDGYTLAGIGQYACTDPDGASGGWRGSATALVDCDDNPATCGAACYPGNLAADVCDSRNQDCDALIDENPNISWYHDLDGDGYTLNTDTALACFDPDGVDIHWKGTATANDCDDNPATCGAGCWPNNPSPDICDGRNQDCDPSIDENPQFTWYPDQDLDTWTAATGSFAACTDPDGAAGAWKGAASNPTDCNDTNASLNHNDVDGDTYDTCENDCNDGNAGLTPADADGDGLSTCGGDCNDGNAGVRPGLSDAPDDTYTDNNCDGIDGTVTSGVFLSPGGSNTSTCGTSIGTPCATLSWAITRAGQLGRSQIFVRTGTYSGVQFLTSVSGITIYGGYNTSWVRGPRTTAQYAATFTGGTTSSQAVGWKVASSSLVIDNVIIQSPNASGTEPSGTHVRKGRSTYAVHSTNSALTFRNTTLEPGDATAGLGATQNGIDASSTPPPAGGRGGNAGDSATACGTGRAGGGGGAVNSACTSANGGGGGRGGQQDTSCGWTGICSNCNATAGLNGGAAATNGGSGGYGWYGGGGAPEWPGGAGQHGRPWIDGSGGSSGQREGSLSGDWWFGGNGGNGTLGQHGTGGGGGGGSGGSDDGNDDWGAGGGGGGAGGCRAPQAGTGGYAGGSSFGVFAYNSTIDVRTSLFNYGNGGAGGNGGTGGWAQPPSSGGSGGSGYESAQPGGNGGSGSWGGYSGGGGGGAGGGVYGIYALGGSTFQSGNSQSSGGTVGSGGSGGPNGVGGSSGESGERTILRTCAITGC